MTGLLSLPLLFFTSPIFRQLVYFIITFLFKFFLFPPHSPFTLGQSLEVSKTTPLYLDEKNMKNTTAFDYWFDAVNYLKDTVSEFGGEK